MTIKGWIYLILIQLLYWKKNNKKLVRTCTKRTHTNMKGRWNAEERSGVPSNYSILSWLFNLKYYWLSSLLHLAWNPCSLEYLHFVTSNYRYISISCVHITDYGSCVLWGKKTKLVWSSVAGNFSMGPLTLPPQQLTRQWQHVPLCDSLLNCTRIFGDFFWQWKQGQHKSRKRKPACCRNVGTAAYTVTQEPLLALAILSHLESPFSLLHGVQHVQWTALWWRGCSLCSVSQVVPISGRGNIFKAQAPAPSLAMRIYFGSALCWAAHAPSCRLPFPEWRSDSTLAVHAFCH